MLAKISMETISDVDASPYTTDWKLRTLQTKASPSPATVETDEPREVTISGAVHIRATTDFFLRMYKDIERAALAIKKISDPPQREDFTTS